MKLLGHWTFRIYLCLEGVVHFSLANHYIYVNGQDSWTHSSLRYASSKRNEKLVFSSNNIKMGKDSKAKGGKGGGAADKSKGGAAKGIIFFFLLNTKFI